MTNPPNILFTYKFENEYLDKIRSEINVIQGSEQSDEFLSEIDLSTIDALVCNNPFHLFDVNAMKSLKWIQLTSSGIDRLPHDIPENLTITNIKSAYSIPISEYVIGKILETYKNSEIYYENKEEKIWEKHYSSRTLFNKRVGILGTGSIGSEIARKLKGFDCEVIGLNTTGKPRENFTETHSIERLQDIISRLDIMIVTLPHTKHTDGLLNHQLLNMMKDDSLLMNISRGEIIVEDDLINLLSQGKFNRVVLDVFKQEPLPKESELWTFPNVVITPHISYVSEYRNEFVFQEVKDNINRFVKNQCLKNQVNINEGY